MNIVVLCGGTSTEREVSLNSGSMVCDALRSIGHNAVLLDVFFGNENKNLLDVSGRCERAGRRSRFPVP